VCFVLRIKERGARVNGDGKHIVRGLEAINPSYASTLSPKPMPHLNKKCFVKYPTANLKISLPRNICIASFPKNVGCSFCEENVST